jgi:hypothetical protein
LFAIIECFLLSLTNDTPTAFLFSISTFKKQAFWVYCKQYKVPYRLHNLFKNRPSHAHYWTLKNIQIIST